MQPTFVHRPAFTAVGPKYHGRNENAEIKQMWEEVFFPRLGEIKGRKGEWLFYGVCGNHDEKTGEFDYLAAVEVESDADIPEGMESWSIPGNTYAVFPCTLSTIHEAFEAAYEEWLPNSGYRTRPDPMFEYYDEAFADGEKMYIYVPVELQG